MIQISNLSSLAEKMEFLQEVFTRLKNEERYPVFLSEVFLIRYSGWGNVCRYVKVHADVSEYKLIKASSEAQDFVARVNPSTRITRDIKMTLDAFETLFLSKDTEFKDLILKAKSSSDWTLDNTVDPNFKALVLGIKTSPDLFKCNCKDNLKKFRKSMIMYNLCCNLKDEERGTELEPMVNEILDKVLTYMAEVRKE